jgi:trehalose 6-phosphate synthase
MDDLKLLYESPVMVTRHSGSRLVVVSNPVPVHLAAPAAGGLAIALESVLKAEGGLWFGWSGETAKDSEPVPRTVTNRGIAFAVSDLSRPDIDGYYHGFANRALWPVCHYRLDLAKLSDANAAAYFRVNAQFACQLAKMLQREDVVWVHDYHLIPMGSFA